MFILYSITCLKNNKTYIGVTNDYYSRCCHHRGSLRSGLHDNRFLQDDYIKYGVTFFVYDVISEFENRVDALRAEKYFTDYLFRMNKSCLYNIVGGGNGMRSSVSVVSHRKPISDSTRKKLSERATNQKQSLESRIKRIASLQGENCYRAKKVIDNATGIIYGSLKDAARTLGVNYSTVRARMNGYNNVKTNLQWHH